MERILLVRRLFFGIFLFVAVPGWSQTTIYQESFETDGEGIRYTRSHIFDSTRSYFKRGAPASFIGSAYTPASITGTSYFSIQNPHLDNDPNVASGAPNDGICTLSINPIDITAFTDLVFSIDLACRSGNLYGPRRFSFNRFYLDVDFQIDGGGWNNLMKVSNSSNTSQRPLFYTDPPADIAGGGADVQLTETLVTFSDSLLATGTSLELRIVIAGNNILRELSFDNLRLTGGGGVGPPADGVRLLHQFCGYVTNNRNQSIWVAANATADEYEFEFSGGDLGSAFIENTGTRRSINLDKTSTQLSYNQTYNVRTRGIFTGIPGQWSDAWYGSCQVRIDTVITGMTTPSCGSVVQLSTPLSCWNVGGATNYRFRVRGTGVDTTFESGGGRQITMNQAAVTNNGFYTVEVGAFVDGAWSSFGNTCTYQVNGASSPTTLVNYQCGASFSNLNSSLRCYEIPNATQYRFEISGDIPTTPINRTVPYLQLSSIPGLGYGGNYSVRIRVTVDGVNSTWGSSCSFSTTSGVPSTGLNSWLCGTSVNEQNSLCASPVGGANYYQFRFSGAGDTTIFTTTNCASFGLTPTMGDGAYTVQVRAIIGSDSGAYDAGCNLTYMSIAGPGAGESFEPESISLHGNGSSVFSDSYDGSNQVLIFPNPADGQVQLSSRSGEILRVRVLDQLGQEVYSYSGKPEFVDLESFESGVFIFVVTTQNGTEYHRVLKK